MDFARALTLCRQSRNLSQAQLSELSGVSHGYISGIECGHRAPSLELSYRLADALDIPLFAIIALSDKEKLDEILGQEVREKLYSQILGLLTQTTQP